MVDADSKDLSTGMAFPPSVFLEERFLTAARESLNDGGLLVMNICSRNPELYAATVKSINLIFPTIYELEVEGDSNRILAATMSPSIDLTSSSSSLKQMSDRIMGIMFKNKDSSVMELIYSNMRQWKAWGSELDENPSSLSSIPDKIKEGEHSKKKKRNPKGRSK